MISFCKCKSYSHFFSKNISIYAIFNDQSFNGTLTNDIVSFEQLGPELQRNATLADSQYEKLGGLQPLEMPGGAGDAFQETYKNCIYSSVFWRPWVATIIFGLISLTSSSGIHILTIYNVTGSANKTLPTQRTHDVYTTSPQRRCNVSQLVFFCKSIAGRYWPVSYSDGPITARYRFMYNAHWVGTHIPRSGLPKRTSLDIGSSSRWGLIIAPTRR